MSVSAGCVCLYRRSSADQQVSAATVLCSDTADTRTNRTSVDSGSRTSVDSGSRTRVDSGSRNRVDGGSRNRVDGGSRNRVDDGSRNRVDSGNDDNTDNFSTDARAADDDNTDNGWKKHSTFEGQKPRLSFVSREAGGNFRTGD